MIRIPLLVPAVLAAALACDRGSDDPSPAVEAPPELGSAESVGDEARGEAREAPPAPMADAAPEASSERARELGPFLAGHWELPVPPQGEPPEGWSEAEASLDPQVCGACHPKQHQEWSTSLHAGAWSPGFAGQLIEGPLSAPAQRHQCMTCHAPLTEQRTDVELREKGIVCASCHVRSHTRYGPPRRPELPPVEGPLPHGGFEEREEFTEARFCATCHQFFDDPGVNGKPIENTYAEWKAWSESEAGDGRTCQSCHMPDRAHLWRGIHDPEMVRSGVSAGLVPVDAGLAAEPGGPIAAALVVKSHDVGHAFPTYVTPRVFLAAWQEDASGEPVAGTREEATIARIVDFSTSREVQDTRVLPGESVKLDYAGPRAAEAVALVGRVTVDPGYHYRGVFENLRTSYQDPEARRLMEEAHQRTVESPYVLYELRRELGPEAPAE